jgi:hypothetical protein
LKARPSDSFEIRQMPVGGRLLYRSRAEWRTAVVVKKDELSVFLSIAAPSGRNYRLRRTGEHLVTVKDGLHFLEFSGPENWAEKFGIYDRRW